MKSPWNSVLPGRAAILPASMAPALPRTPDVQRPTGGRRATAPDPAASARSVAGRAFWATLRKIVLVAAAVDVSYFVLFRMLGVPELAWPNISSVALYLTAYALIRLHVNSLAVALIWTEVLLHAAAGTLLIGWDSGFHYYMLLFIPAIVASCTRVYTGVLLALLFVCYLGLDVCSYLFGATAPIAEPALAVVRWTNLAIVFGMLSYAALCYRARLRRTEEWIRISATHDLLTGLVNPHHFMAMAEYALALQRRSRRPTSVALLEIDQLQLAHQDDAADRILAHVCQVLCMSCREEDVIARWHGNELIALLPDTALGSAALAAERMREAVADAPVALGPSADSVRCTVSIGVAEVVAGEPLYEALHRAERALDRSRSQGRNRMITEPSPAPAEAGLDATNRTPPRTRMAG